MKRVEGRYSNWISANYAHDLGVQPHIIETMINHVSGHNGRQSPLPAVVASSWTDRKRQCA